MYFVVKAYTLCIVELSIVISILRSFCMCVCVCICVSVCVCSVSVCVVFLYLLGFLPSCQC